MGVCRSGAAGQLCFLSVTRPMFHPRPPRRSSHATFNNRVLLAAVAAAAAVSTTRVAKLYVRSLLDASLARSLARSFVCSVAAAPSVVDSPTGVRTNAPAKPRFYNVKVRLAHYERERSMNADTRPVRPSVREDGLARAAPSGTDEWTTSRDRQVAGWLAGATCMEIASTYEFQKKRMTFSTN